MLRTLRPDDEPGTRVWLHPGRPQDDGALLLSCMGLLGHSQDRVLHVLVNPTFD